MKTAARRQPLDADWDVDGTQGVTVVFDDESPEPFDFTDATTATKSQTVRQYNC